MTLDAGPESPTLLSTWQGAQATSADDELLRRVCTKDRLAQFVQQFGADFDLRIGIVTADGALLEAVNFDAYRPDTSGEYVRVPLRHAHHQVGQVLVSSDSGACAGPVARLLALWLEDVLRLEYELNSLTHEVVHAYEELHVLYELGEQFSGVLEVEAVCRLVAQAVIDALRAARVQLILTHDDHERIVADVAQAERVMPERAASVQTAAVLRINEQAVGRIIVEGKLVGSEFTSDDLKLLEGIAGVASTSIHAAQLYEAARYRADTDGLTGICNHRRLQERIDEEIDRARRHAHPLTIILADLDNFKLFNDVYGHPVGDRVLQTVTESLQASIRSYDIIGRYGGDEFMIILPETDAHGAAEVAERVLADIATREIVVDNERLPLAMSLGLASFPGDATSKHELIAHADSALYESKRSGGRAVRVARGPRSDWLALQSSSFGVLEGLVQSVDAKDHYTREHSDVVTEIAVMLAQHLKLSEETRRALRIAGLLHDVGKIGIPDHVLKKLGRLSREEYEIMKQHVQLSEMMIKNVPYLNDVLDAVAHHHERYDGTGYPYGKAAQDIPLLGRIMAIADAYSAMCMDRPYRKGLSWSEARHEFLGGAGTQFDPDLVAHFIQVMDDAHATSLAPYRAEAA